MESLGPGDASFAPFDFIFGTKQVYSVPRLLREVRGDIYIITSKSELKLVFSVVFLYKHKQHGSGPGMAATRAPTTSKHTKYLRNPSRTKKVRLCNYFARKNLVIRS